MGFKSVLKHIGEDFKIGLEAILPYAETAGRAAITIFAPSLGPMFNSTLSAVVLAEQNAVALGKQSGSGPQKLAAVLQLMEPVISQGLKDAGKDGTQAEVIEYINSVVTILNTIPAKL